MRSYLDIIVDLKEGRKPDYEEVRLACLMANDLLYFADEDVKRLGKFYKEDERKDIPAQLMKKNFENRFYARKKSPEEWLGNHHPDHPDQKASMERSKKIYAGFLKAHPEYAEENSDEKDKI